MNEAEFNNAMNKLTVLADLSGTKMERSVSLGLPNGMNASDFEKALVCVALYNYANKEKMSWQSVCRMAYGAINSIIEFDFDAYERDNKNHKSEAVVGGIYFEQQSSKFWKYVIVNVNNYAAAGGGQSGGTFTAILVDADNANTDTEPVAYEFSRSEIANGNFVLNFHDVDFGGSYEITVPEPTTTTGAEVDVDINETDAEGNIVTTKTVKVPETDYNTATRTISVTPQFTGYKGGNCFETEMQIPENPPVNPDLHKGGCCVNPTIIPTDPADMLSISTLMPHKNEVYGLNRDIAMDILGDGADSSFDKFKNNANFYKTHGTAMGMLHPALDSGKSTGYGFFRGNKIHGFEAGTGKPKYNIFLIGHAWSVDFVSVIANGFAGNVDIGQASSPCKWAHNIIETDENKTQNEFMDWCYAQAQQGRMELLEYRTENSNDDAMLGSLDFYKDNNNEYDTDGRDTKNGNRCFIPNGNSGDANSNRHSRLSQAIAEQTLGGGFKGYEQFTAPGGDGKFKNVASHSGNWQGISWNLPSLLYWLDEKIQFDGHTPGDLTGRVIVICLDRATKSNGGSLGLSNWLSIAKTAINLAASVVGLSGVTNKAFDTVVQAANAGINLVKPISNIVTGSFQANDLINTAAALYQMGLSFENVIGEPVKDIEKLVEGVKSFTKEYAAKFNTYLDDVDRYTGGAVKLAKKMDAGGLFTQMMGLSGAYGSVLNQPLQYLIGHTTGITPAQIKDYSNLLNNRLEQAKKDAYKPPYYQLGIKTDDLNKAISVWDSFTTLSLGDTLSNFFTKDVPGGIQQWMLNMQTTGNNFLHNPMLRGFILKTACGAMMGMAPTAESVIGGIARLNGNSATGSGLDFAMNTLGLDSYYGLVKTGLGFPSKATEMLEVFKQGFLVDAGFDTINDGIPDDARVILPSTLSGELQECIACSFQTSGIKTQRCAPGQVYNWVTGRCVRPMFNGFVSNDCFKPCEEQKQIDGDTLIPAGIKECNGRYYFDTNNCGLIEQAVVALDTLVEGVNQATTEVFNG
jgi:hypothetical protein